MRFVATKTAEQLDLQGLHRVRARLVSERTATVNEIRAFLLDRGIAVAQGIQRLRRALPDILGTHHGKLSPRMVRIIEALASDWRRLDQRVDEVSAEIEMLASPIISSATVATIGSGDMFARGRDFGAWLGMVPKQTSTGGRPILGKISKRGNKYLRTLFVQAARVVLVKRVSWERYGLKAWIEAAAKRLHHNKLAIALAYKLARIAWAVLRYGRIFEVCSSHDNTPQHA